jgi:hypothetical protein
MLPLMSKLTITHFSLSQFEISKCFCMTEDRRLDLKVFGHEMGWDI